MNVLIVYCHPEPKSFNGSLKDAAAQFFLSTGHNVDVSNLYEENFDSIEKGSHYPDRVIVEKFDPLSEQRNAYKTDTLPEDVAREIQRLKWCDLLILQFPLWWHQQPAMLKGWFDRVFVAGSLYTSKMRYDRGYFNGKQVICSVTSGSPLETFTQKGRAGGEISTLLHSLNYSLHYMGFTVFPTHLITEVQGAGFSYKEPEQLANDLELQKNNWVEHLMKLQAAKPLSFPSWDDWDVNGVEKHTGVNN